MTIMDKLTVFIYDYLWGTPMVVLLVGTSIIAMVATNFFPLRYFGRIMKVAVRNILGKNGENEGNGILNQLQATSMALGTTIGVGNISGVATAIAVGGPGALFWMWVSALFGMALKMAEITLALYYRENDTKGKKQPYGSPLYYIEKGIGKEKKLKTISCFLIFIMTIGAVSTFVINIQTYTVSEAIGNTFNIGFIPIGIIYTILLYLMIGKGVKNLGKISGILIPIMCLFYIICGLLIIALNISSIPGLIGMVVKSAFTGSAAAGGFLGATVTAAMRTGVSKAVFSNEAGWGTAPTIHASAKVDHPVKQGIMGVFEVFVDTFVICTITAFVVLLSGQWTSGLDGATLTLTAFEGVIGKPGRIILALSVFIFGLTTSSGVFAQIETYVRYFGGKFKLKKGNVALSVYKWLYPLPSLFMLIFAVKFGYPGAQLWLLSDMTTAIPIFANCIAILLLMPTFRNLVKDYKNVYIDKSDSKERLKPFYD